MLVPCLMLLIGRNSFLEHLQIQIEQSVDTYWAGRDSGGPASMTGLITGERGIFRSLRSVKWEISCL